MTSEDWYRNKDWNSQIERSFFAKLRRARRKEQYLRIQASTLASSHPIVALRLLDEYFKLNDNFDHAQAHVDRATAYLAMGQVDDAIQAYEDALAREEEFPNLQTQANLDLPFLAASLGSERLYDRCIQLLDKSQSSLTFPVDHFRWHATNALILNAQGKQRRAKTSACEALTWAERKQSGFRYHPTNGLVGGEYEATKARLKEICNA
jgi:tetratricopeptide (TPR) repeat protein